MSLYSITKTISASEKSPLTAYFTQNTRTILCIPLRSNVNEKNLETYLAWSLFFELGLSIIYDNQSFFSDVDINSNLHLRIESTINGDNIFDSDIYRIPTDNPVLAIGKTEKSLISYSLTLQHLFKLRNDVSQIDPAYMYRKFLHLGNKPSDCLNYFENPYALLEQPYIIHSNEFNQHFPDITSII